jgi:hypothetical protein
MKLSWSTLKLSIKAVLLRGKVGSKKIKYSNILPNVDLSKLRPFHLALALAVTLSFSGFFYSLQQITLSVANPVLAKENIHKNNEAVPDTFGQKICQSSQDNYSATNSSLEDYKSKELCQESETDASTELAKILDEQQALLEQEIEPILSGTPMESMIKPISQQDKIVAAFLVGIALKESHLGRRAPVKNGQDCYNYWGYKGGINPTAGGYSCFSSPEEAVKVVGKRLKKLAIEQKRNTPNKMLVWKCGSSCAGHSANGVQKWISDVSIYFNKVNHS